MGEPRREVPESDIVTDAMLDGRLVLRQPRRGHRAGTDAVLLAAACAVKPGDVLVDVGSGVGTVGLALALREPRCSGFLLDDDPSISALADENCRLNRLETRIVAVSADLFDPAARRAVGLAEERANVVVTNPPFFVGTETRMSADPGKASAYLLRRGAETHGLAEWVCAGASLLAPMVRFYAIHRPEALPALLSACEGRLGALVLVPVYAKAGGPALRVLISGVKGSRAALSMGSPFVLHQPDGRFTPEAEAVHRGEANLPMQSMRTPVEGR